MFKKFLAAVSISSALLIPAMAFAQEVQPTSAELNTLQNTASFATASDQQAGMLAALGAMGFILVLVAIPFLAIWIFGIVCMIKIAQKTNTPNGWLVIIPFVAPFKLAKFAGYSYWWGAMSLLPLFGYIINEKIMMLFQLVVLGFFIYAFMRICQRLGFSKWLGLLAIIPVANLVLLGVLAFSKNQLVENTQF